MGAEALLLAGVLAGTAGCGSAAKGQSAAPATETAAPETEANSDAETEAQDDTAETETAEANVSSGDDGLYKELSDWEYIYTSGAGAWQTTFTVSPDGNFKGDYSDSDMGTTGPGYEEGGTVYTCNFTGQFTGYTKVSDYVYELELGEMTYQKEPGTEEIEDGIRYCYEEPAGLSGVDSLIVYLPGTPIEDVSEDYLTSITPLNFSAYLGDDGDYYEDLPAELPFCGLYNQTDDAWFFSGNASDQNKTFIMNRAHFPGLVSQKTDLNEDGTYRYEDGDPSGMYRVVNFCFPVADDMSIYTDPEGLAKACIKEMDGNEDPENLYCLTLDTDSNQDVKTYLSGQRCIQVSWTEGSNEDTMNWTARVMKVDGYEPGNGKAFMYAVGYDPDGDLMTGEAADFYLTSLSLTGSPDHLSSASDVTADEQFYAEVTKGKSSGTLQAEKVEMIGGDDTEKLKEYNIDPDDVTNDYAIGGFDGNYDEYSVEDGCGFYIQYPDNPFQQYVDESGFNDYMDKGGESRLMVLYLDSDGCIVFAYEPYTP